MLAARAASLLRNATTVDLINEALDRIAAGLRIGRERQLVALTNELVPEKIHAWCVTQDRRRSRVTHMTVDAMLIGDGSAET
jgi:hypothetical protein